MSLLSLYDCEFGDCSSDSDFDVEGMEESSSDTQSSDDKNESKNKLFLVCGVCLDRNSEDSNEIVECDNCGISVHEECYGLKADDASVSSANSSYSTQPWFCDACRAAISAPKCELCPKIGGIYKETDTGKWVHLVCALYVPRVAFHNVEKLSNVTLSEMPQNKGRAKSCSLCDEPSASTGVCIGCDAGMCKAYFHVTCAQADGLLVDPRTCENAAAADPFFGHCKLHSEKEIVKKQKEMCSTFYAHIEERLKQKANLKQEDPSPSEMRTQRWLTKSQKKYAHVRTEQLKKELVELKDRNAALQKEVAALRAQNDEQLKIKNALEANHTSLLSSVELHKHLIKQLSFLARLLPGINLTELLSTDAEPAQATPSGGTSSAAGSTDSVVIPIFKCTICERDTDQDLLTKCDTCCRHYHLGCSNPPLTRHPKRSKLYGWQCSNCTQLDDENKSTILVNGPRQSRTKYTLNGSFERTPILQTRPSNSVLSPNPNASTSKKTNKAKAKIVKMISPPLLNKNVLRPQNDNSSNEPKVLEDPPAVAPTRTLDSLSEPLIDSVIAAVETTNPLEASISSESPKEQ